MNDDIEQGRSEYPLRPYRREKIALLVPGIDNYLENIPAALASGVAVR